MLYISRYLLGLRAVVVQRARVHRGDACYAGVGRVFELSRVCVSEMKHFELRLQTFGAYHNASAKDPEFQTSSACIRYTASS